MTQIISTSWDCNSAPDNIFGQTENCSFARTKSKYTTEAETTADAGCLIEGHFESGADDIKASIFFHILFSKVRAATAKVKNGAATMCSVLCYKDQNGEESLLAGHVGDCEILLIGESGAEIITRSQISFTARNDKRLEAVSNYIGDGQTEIDGDVIWKTPQKLSDITKRVGANPRAFFLSDGFFSSIEREDWCKEITDDRLDKKCPPELLDAKAQKQLDLFNRASSFLQQHGWHYDHPLFPQMLALYAITMCSADDDIFIGSIPLSGYKEGGFMFGAGIDGISEAKEAGVETAITGTSAAVKYFQKLAKQVHKGELIEFNINDVIPYLVKVQICNAESPFISIKLPDAPIACDTLKKYLTAEEFEIDGSTPKEFRIAVDINNHTAIRKAHLAINYAMSSEVGNMLPEWNWDSEINKAVEKALLFNQPSNQLHRG